MSTLIEKLDYLMQLENISKGQLAKESDIPYTTIDGFYKKGTDNVKLSTLKKLANYFRCSMDYLTDDNVPIEQIYGVDLTKKLRGIRLSKRLTLDDIEYFTGIPQKEIGNYEDGYSMPDIGTLALLCSVYKVHISYFISNPDVKVGGLVDNYPLPITPSNNFITAPPEQELLKKYRNLDQYGRKIIGTLLDLELERLGDIRNNVTNFDDIVEKSKKKNYTKRMRIYGKISAGLGVEAIEDYEEIYGPDQADFALIVDGHSMEPEFSDKQIIYIKKTSQFENGQIMAVQVEDDFFMQAYLKIVKRDAHDPRKIRLISLNESYEDQLVDANLLSVIGAVVE